MADFTIEYPGTLAEALSFLDPDDPSVRPVGGGTALMLMMKSQMFHPTRLVCLSRLSEPMTGCREDGDHIRIGAMTTLSQVEHSALIAAEFPVIHNAMKNLANVRVRNVATIGGNLAHGDPHLDLPPIWAALGAEAIIHGPSGQRSVKVEDLFQGYYETDVADGELITEIRVPRLPGWRATYRKVTTRALHDWPAIGLTLAARFDGDRIADIRLVLSAAVDIPQRLRGAEEVLRGHRPDAMLLARAGDSAAAEAPMEHDSRGSVDYKVHLLKVHILRGMNEIGKG
ncbi:FAD binding domain-containing protein [Roseovarius nitratireducens]|uniref:FAD binding domain-containing protein n=1 Tax=Roseovarius nitratireducens TaxID=2044597 RepID=UPI000CE2565A|nr:xanthine dehydrogenase family protein subunit M [Roseovarius nitratireducens]